ncbi:MAG: hypothetical protein KME29_31620 [Calothrix sp. FI2-JRJ7]|nr:hypothetical protein [Calothrix sp. FI2-JRJ7]
MSHQPQHKYADPLLKAKLLIIQERLRQAHYSFNFALISASVSLLVSITGATLLFSNQTSETAATTACGLFASIGCMRVAKDANNRLDKIIAELDSENDNNNQ